MALPDPLKTATVAEFAAEAYLDGDVVSAALPAGQCRRRAALDLAAEATYPLKNKGILAPALRARLDSMSRDYARILTRIDQVSRDAAIGAASPRDRVARLPDLS